MNAMHDLQHQVQAALTDDNDTRDYGIEVLDSNGVITLRGVPGVTSVIDELDVV
jgi:hypothetical protein